MKKQFLLLILITSATISYAQQISRSIITTAGDTAKSKDGNTVSWTIGDVFGQTIQKEDHLTEGFQQGLLTNKKSSKERKTQASQSIAQYEIAEIKDKIANITLTTFPNPTTDQLFIRTKNLKTQNMFVNILDASGKIISQQNINIKEGQDISISNIEQLEAGIYFLQLTDNQQPIISKQFVKM